jgi:hypothetical protein
MCTYQLVKKIIYAKTSKISVADPDPVLFTLDPNPDPGRFFPDLGSLPHLKIQFRFLKYENLKVYPLRNEEKEEKLNLF